MMAKWSPWSLKLPACTVFTCRRRQYTEEKGIGICNFVRLRSESRTSFPASILIRDANLIVYEYPFNERIRTLLRLEDLYEKFSFFVQQAHPLQHHVALSTIFEMLEVAGRADLKSDLLQELERQRQTLLGFKSNPNVQAERLDAILAEVDQASSALIAAQGKTGQHVRESEWLMSIRGRSARLNNATRTSSTGLLRLIPCSMRSASCCGCCENPDDRPKSSRKRAATSKCCKARFIRCCA